MAGTLKPPIATTLRQVYAVDYFDILRRFAIFTPPSRYASIRLMRKTHAQRRVSRGVAPFTPADAFSADAIDDFRFIALLLAAAEA